MLANRLNLNTVLLLVLGLVIAFIVAAPSLVQASSHITPIPDPRSPGQQFGLGDESSFKNVGLGKETDLKETIADLINIVLGFLGIIAVIIVMFGGFKWMTAAGNEEQVSQARQLIVGGIIGLVVIFMAWAIASFVVSSLQGATA